MLASGASHSLWQIPPEISMRLLSGLMMTLAAIAAPGDQPVVEVFLSPVFGFDMSRAFGEARNVAGGIYSDIGVRVVWRLDRSAPTGCTKQPLHSQIVVAMVSSTRAGHSEETWAFSNPQSTKGPCVTLLMDQLNPAIKTNPLSTGFLLGHVLAHEMGHVLQGIARHSETGVMKGYWSLHDTAKMTWQERLSFTAYDAELILDALGSPAVLPGGIQSQRLPEPEAPQVRSQPLHHETDGKPKRGKTP
jgi:hypothetical protein